MKVWATSITSLARQGRLSLQVPQLAVGFVGNRPTAFRAADDAPARDLADVTDGTIEAPDSWFWTLKVVSGKRQGAVVPHRICRGREVSHGRTFLSPEGYAANRSEVLSAYAGAGGEPDRFEAFAQAFFADVGRRTAENDQRRLDRGLRV